MRITQNSIYSRFSSLETKQSGMSADASSIEALFVGALQLTKRSSPEARDQWQELHEACREEKKNFSDLVGNFPQGKTAVEEVLELKDWRSAIRLFTLLPEGEYAEKRVCRTKNGLFQIKNSKPNGPGLCMDNETVYMGEFKDGNANGFGKLIHLAGDTYVGEWSEGKRHGWGKLSGKALYQYSAEGLFVENNYVGNPKTEKGDKPTAIGQLKEWIKQFFSGDE
ncbi:MAG: hypothetical protein EOO77_07220 [Oxalobacteraceae bacterium]|nr:MAG: hypothetical protein EOO77_07220 [Oxalobacteraceae bacterium]